MADHQPLDASAPLWSDLAPVLLTPVRLETRYLLNTAPPVLAIRVVPDDIARYNFEPDLTAAEHAAGTAYWTACAEGADSTAAWVQVQNQLGDARGAWAVEVTRPDSTISDPGTRTTVQAASSLILPDYFTFSGLRDGKLIFQQDGFPLPADLFLGPDWSKLVGNSPDDPADQHPWTGASKWMIDLDEAVRIGMAVRVPLTGTATVTGTNLALDSITVVGVSSGSSADGADRLARTLQGHLYTSGLGYPPPGSPTNNTDATRSQWSSAPTMRSPDEVAAAIAAAAPGLGQPGVALADALGLADDLRPGVPGRRDLLAAPLGTQANDPHNLTERAHQVISTYYRTLTQGGRLTSDAIAAHFVSFVRAGGPFPVLRVGRQPYGVLPVTDLGTWTATDPPDVAGDVYRAVIKSALGLDALIGLSPHLSADPRQDEDPVLLGIFQRQPTATQLRALNDTHSVYGESMPPGTAPPFDPSVSVPFDLTPGPPADPGSPPSPPTWPLAAMAQHTFLGPLDPRIDTDLFSTPVPVLNDLCHQNGAYWAVQAYAALHWQGALLAAQGFLGTKGSDTTEWNGYTGAFETALQPLRDLEADAASDWSAVDTQVSAAVTALGQRPDAWATSVATARLQALRSTTATGIHLGMYGWVVDVEPLSPEARASESGWTLTPSAQHAVTACVLFAGAEAHNSTAFNIDLTSAQVRRAQTLLAGLRDGSTLEELLGYQLERALHDNHLDAAIAPLRNDYPLPVVPATGLPDAARTARLVVNGEAVRRDPNAEATIVSLLTAADRDAVHAIVKGLNDTVDAASDVLLAESVHHLIGGSPLRAGLTLDTIGKAGPPPQSLDAITTPTAAVTVTHNLALVVGTPDPNDASWFSGPLAARANLDPAAEAVAAWALGSSDDWRIDVTDATSHSVTSLTPTDLEISAIDLVAELTSPPDASALAARARAHLTAPAGSAITVHRTDGHGGPDAAALLVAAIRAVLVQAQPVLDPATILDPASDPTIGEGPDGLTTRVTEWWTSVYTALKSGGAATSVLPDLAKLGLQGARFDSPPSTLTQLINQWGNASDILADLPTATGAAGASARLTKLASTVRAAAGDWFTASTSIGPADGALPGGQPTSGASDDDVADWIASHTPMCAGVAALADLLMVSGACGAAGNPQWIVRQNLTADADGPWASPNNPGAWIGGSDTGGRSGIALTGLQVGDPASQTQTWVSIDHWSEALPFRFKVDTSPSDSTDEASPPDSTAGREHAAAVSLRFDSPDSRAPQALLLAVPPAPQRGWSRTDVQNAVQQTLLWTMARPVDGDDVPESNWS
jgi:hypothetical protein